MSLRDIGTSHIQRTTKFTRLRPSDLPTGNARPATRRAIFCSSKCQIFMVPDNHPSIKSRRRVATTVRLSSSWFQTNISEHRISLSTTAYPNMSPFPASAMKKRQSRGIYCLRKRWSHRVRRFSSIIRSIGQTKSHPKSSSLIPFVDSSKGTYFGVKRKTKGFFQFAILDPGHPVGH